MHTQILAGARKIGLQRSSICAPEHKAYASRGFTLVELMTVVAVVGLLAAVAYPAYVKQVIRGQRSLGQNFVMDLAQREEQYFNDNRSYATAANQIGYAALPADVVTVPPAAPLYAAPVFATTVGPPPTWTITLAPAAGSSLANKNDGTLVINNLGERFRTVQGHTTMGAGDCTFENGTCIAQ